MTVADLIQRFPRRREIFPGPIEQDINLAEFLANGKQQEDATLAGLDRWRDDQQ